ncbi:MAG TPA: hypothetical protein GXX19_00150 [Syntrophomonadaceae bacterium]|nr:hypothetical protein [Syntrophomonadaceae bacterium]
MRTGMHRMKHPAGSRRADLHAAYSTTNRGMKKRFILAGAATYGGCYSPLTKEQLTAAEAKQEVELGDYAPWMAS